MCVALAVLTEGFCQFTVVVIQGSSVAMPTEKLLPWECAVSTLQGSADPLIAAAAECPRKTLHLRHSDQKGNFTGQCHDEAS